MPRFGERYIINGIRVFVDAGAALPRRCVRCQAPSEFLCDYPVVKGVTCDAPLCPACAKEIGPDRHYCPLHVKIVECRTGPLL